MKTFLPYLKHNLKSIFVVSLLSIGVLSLSSCLKSDDEVVVSETFLRVITVSPTLATYDVYINNEKANTAALPFGGTLKYLKPKVGNCDIKFNIANDTETVLSKSVTLNANVAYSYYLIGKAPNMDGMLVVDQMSTTDAAKAYVKFINLSPDASNLSLAIKDGASIANDKAYKVAGDFVAVDPKTVTFEVKDGAGNVKTTLSNEVLSGGRYYTVIARGLNNPTDLDRAFSAQVIINQ